MIKDFRQDFYKFLNKLKNHKNFSFGRFSDGELRILQNIPLTLGPKEIRIGNIVKPSKYKEHDHKHFDPNIHQFYRDKLIEAFKFKKPNYYKGISCRCCVGEKDFQWQLDLYGGDDNSLTWANLWVNGNYSLFIEHFIPEFKKHSIIFICNENANLSKLPFQLVKDFRIGKNAIINDYNLIEKIKLYIQENHIKNHIFLFSASSLSNYLAHQLFEFNDQNTYIDIGTTLNKYIDLPLDRGYLDGYWHKKKNRDLEKICIW